jgi:flagellar motor protein MotB
MPKTEQELLLFDYEKTLEFLNKADGLLFQIKNWAIVSCSAVLAFGVSQKSLIIVAGTFFLIAGFCLLELVYKSFHDDCIAKSYGLEKLIQDSLKPSFVLPSGYEFGVGHAIEPPRFRRLLGLLLKKDRWHIGIFYFMIGVLALVTMVYVRHPKGMMRAEDGEAVKAAESPKDSPVPIVMPWSIYFPTNRSTLGFESLRDLAVLARNLSSNQGTILIEGHTDSRGGGEYNSKLSEERAEAVRFVLVQGGVGAERIRLITYGESHPVDSSDTLEGRLMNRRVVIRLERPTPPLERTAKAAAQRQ